jgi:hypothetical protein
MPGDRAPGQPIQPRPFDPAELTSGGSARVGDSGGAAGGTLDDCMAVWDPTTHMSKDEWRVTCKRTLKDYPQSP